LDSEEVAQELYEFQEGDIRRVRLFLPEIHCSSCIWLLENLYKIHEGVLNSEVHFVKKECYITFNIKKISFRELAVLLDKIGYPPKFGKQDVSTPGIKKRFYLQLAIAGFAFGNIMLMSFPEYVSVDDSFAKEFRILFSYIILVLSIPVLVFSLRDYLLSGFKALRAKTVNLDVPISIGIISLYLRSLYDIISGAGPGYMDSFAGFAFFLLIGKWFQNRTYQALSFERDYKSYFPMAITRIVEKREEIVPIEQIREGDILRIRNEEIIPTDGEVLEGNPKIDYSFVTGESKPVIKSIGDDVFAGGKQYGEAIVIRAKKAVEQSYLTRLWNQKVFHKEVKNTLEDWTDRLSTFFIIGVLIVATLSGIVWSFLDSSQIINVLTSVLIVACPCALALAIPFAFGNAMRVAGRQKMYIKNTAVIEQLSKVTDIVFDKTGTITYPHKAKVIFEGQLLSPKEQNAIYSIVRNSMHPLSEGIQQYLKENGAIDLPVEQYQEKAGLGISAMINNTFYKVGSARWLGQKQEDPSGTRVYIEKKGKVLGFFNIQNVYRPGFKEAQSGLVKSFGLHLLSGDNDSERSSLTPYFPNIEQVHFNQKPLDKLEYIQKLKDRGLVVMMLGDGLNDAGALKASDVGVVVTDNIYNFSPASDIILNANAFSKLPDLLSLGKFSVKILKYSYLFSLTYNTLGLYFAVTNQLTPLIAAILMPLSSISVVLFTTLSLLYYEKKRWKK